MPAITRRTALLSAAAAPASLALPASAQAHDGGGHAMPRARSFTLGEFHVTTLLSGSVPREEPQSIFGMNVSAEDFAQVSEENFIGTDAAQFFFTPTLVDTGSERILFDTGLNAASLEGPLAEAGYAPADITHVVLTHMHGDHIGGMTTEAGELTYTEAAYLTGQVEYDAWAAQENEGFDAKVRPFAERFTFLGDGDAVTSGVTAMAAFGHTPGHMTYMLESGGQQMMLIADLANHYVWSLGYPDWEVRFDMDKAAAAASRRRVLGMLAADRVPMIGYHMPFPAAGFVETRGDGFRYVPVSYQFMG
ncbi:MBL fold metallo-hydrolase [Rhodovulum sp. 12E13]|uniref:MBL fold metallo-hydrolase n=1 Tax=Rhodovulum sp. 12E13 TaxID=2203891 RepID=UPI000E192C07|nr:MBL fold metallo-hydrolase [Rhodovulum sp. 12E13]RDC68057.1 MBL fold metallo-hydrolase [Rhodovulum sp. 12E13]